jgi:hypothetical protein
MQDMFSDTPELQMRTPALCCGLGYVYTAFVFQMCTASASLCVSDVYRLCIPLCFRCVPPASLCVSDVYRLHPSAAAVTAKPGFLPPGALATYTEVFDKTGLTEPVWGLRRDMSWGTMSGGAWQMVKYQGHCSVCLRHELGHNVRCRGGGKKG